MSELLGQDPSIHTGPLLYEVPVELTAKPYPEYSEYRLLAEAVVAIGERNKQIEYQRQQLAEAHLDPVTLLPNRRAFEHDLDAAMSRATFSEPVALVIIDADNLKRINDTLGHAVGDRYLKVIAERLDKTMRNFDRAYRIGGDEDAIIMPNVRWSTSETEDDAAYRIQQRVKKYVNFGINVEGFPEHLHPGVSVGVAISRTSDSTKDIFERADSHLYEDKAKTKKGLQRRNLHMRNSRQAS